MFSPSAPLSRKVFYCILRELHKLSDRHAVYMHIGMCVSAILLIVQQEWIKMLQSQTDLTKQRLSYRISNVVKKCNDGAWLSLVERCVRDAEVAGSNPVAPIGKEHPDGCSFSIDMQVWTAISLRPERREGAEGAACRWHAFSTDRAGRRDLTRSGGPRHWADRSGAKTAGSNPVAPIGKEHPMDALFQSTCRGVSISE